MENIETINIDGDIIRDTEDCKWLNVRVWINEIDANNVTVKVFLLEGRVYISTTEPWDDEDIFEHFVDTIRDCGTLVDEQNDLVYDREEFEEAD